MKKLLSHGGETLLETLFSVAIIAVTFLSLTGAVTAAARVNNRIKNSDSEFRIASSGNSTLTAFRVEITNSDGVTIADPVTVNVKIYSSGGYYYYRVGSSGAGG